MITRFLDVLPFLVGCICGGTVGFVIAILMSAAHDANEELSRHVHRNYTVQKGEGQ